MQRAATVHQGGRYGTAPRPAHEHSTPCNRVHSPAASSRTSIRIYTAASVACEDGRCRVRCRCSACLRLFRVWLRAPILEKKRAWLHCENAMRRAPQATIVPSQQDRLPGMRHTRHGWNRPRLPHLFGRPPHWWDGLPHCTQGDWIDARYPDTRGSLAGIL